MNDEHLRQSMVFKALSDIKRLSIIELLRTGEKCACVLLEDLELSQSGLSYHMKILCDSEIVTSRIEGKWTYYKLDIEGRNKAVDLLIKLTTPDMDSVICKC